MDEYISREAVVRYLKEFSEKELNSSSSYGMITSSVLNKAERAISEIPAADVQPVNGWILVKDRLPEHGDTVVIKTTSNNYLIATYSINPSGVCIEEPGAWFIHNATSMTLFIKGVTHWMSFPKIPKEE